MIKMKPGNISENYSVKEFRCKCGCGVCNVSKGLLERLEALRKYVDDDPINVISGCRCPTHNKNEGGVKDSAHVADEDQECEGADITTSRYMYKLLQGALIIFDRVGIKDMKRNMIHVDTDKTKIQPYFWTYPKRAKDRK
jgi:uncharacterized protein YcbK (DUF882 family)